jgi:hypothetical protein
MAIGDIIFSTDLATLRTSLNTILNGSAVGSGYNQGVSIVANPAVGALVDDAYHDSLISSAGILANYYNISNPFVAVNAAGLIQWSHYATSAATFNTVINNYHSSPWLYATGWDTTVANELSSSKSNWNSQISWDFNVAFSSAAQMNAWFAAGGEIRVSMSHNSSATTQAASWQGLSSDLGTFTISYKPTNSANTNLATCKRYSDLGASYATVGQRASLVTQYTVNTVQVQAYKNTTTIFIRMILNDAYTSIWGDIVTGTTTVTASTLELTNAVGSVNITNPTWTTTAVL